MDTKQITEIYKNGLVKIFADEPPKAKVGDVCFMLINNLKQLCVFTGIQWIPFLKGEI